MSDSLKRWNHRLHQITGAMARKWGKVAAGDLVAWESELRTLADEMKEERLNVHDEAQRSL